MIEILSGEPEGCYVVFWGALASVRLSCGLLWDTLGRGQTICNTDPNRKKYR
jgi:hypothetical protein